MSSANIKENDVVLCTVTKIDSGGVFVKLDEYKIEGYIILAEISPGRIRNIREFVSVGKKIVCKVLRNKDNNIILSLRRVSAKERDTILEHYKKERIFASILKSVVGDKTQELIDKIKDKEDIAHIIDNIRSNPELLKKYITSKELDKLKEILSQKKEAEKVVQKKISLKSDKENGISDIKDILQTKEADISYLGSSNFLIRVKGNEYKIANSQLDKIIEIIKEKAKKAHVQLEIK
ncbi:S1 RNA-binding domain-containing protein [Candidatus Pacearchaeota archaeon]|nr:S1 RNA-binding domain-containing protein [Candidatus Pacearchaeota archaeon]